MPQALCLLGYAEGIVCDGFSTQSRCKELADGGVNLLGQRAIPLPPIIITLQEILWQVVHDVSTQKIGQFLDGALCEDTQAGLDIGDAFIECCHIGADLKHLLVENSSA